MRLEFPTRISRGIHLCLAIAASAATMCVFSGCDEKKAAQCMKKAQQAWEHPKNYVADETRAEYDKRMAWWAKARFGMFIHWGIYSVPAGEWQGRTNYAEWIMNHGQIPVPVYEKFAAQFNPVKFDPDAWAAVAKDAGMEYLVITSKHHDGFCMFDSQFTKYDVMDATPFKRDVIGELDKACVGQGVKFCVYYSIMDWHHPDYVPRRKWEKRSAEGADYDRYVDYMRKQLAELVCRYHPSLIWFDGGWESTWNHERGVKLYNYLRTLDPDLIINNRLDKGRSAAKDGVHAGDYGTPEQHIPATGMPKGVYWETCMTMNRHWGWNKSDKNFKSAEDLIRKLADIASKGGNFLLNVGPTPTGELPKESVEILREIGKWMKTNGESIRGTTASAFQKLPWGRSTTKERAIYLHVFEWPEDGVLKLPGLLSKPEKAELLANGQQVETTMKGSYGAVLKLTGQAPDPIDSVIKLTFADAPVVANAPDIKGNVRFVDKTTVEIVPQPGFEARYTTDGTEPTASSPAYKHPLEINKSLVVKTRSCLKGKMVGPTEKAAFEKLSPLKAVHLGNTAPGLVYKTYRGSWHELPDFSKLKPVSEGAVDSLSLGKPAKGLRENYAVVFSGYIEAPQTGLYTFHLTSDDGSKMLLHGKTLVSNDGEHAAETKKNIVMLERGLHPVEVQFFQSGGDIALKLEATLPNGKKKELKMRRPSH